MLEIKNLNKNFDKHQVLNDINYKFEYNKIYGLIGKNGAGKTTLFDCISNKLKHSGEILLDNHKIKIDNVGYVLTNPLVPEFLTGREFLSFFLNENNNTNLKSVDEYFDLLKIKKEDRDKLLKDYSHGTKNKLQILINILSDNKIILLDEPLSNLDVIVIDEIKKMLKSIKKDHIIIFSTHILDLALNMCDEIVILNDGKLKNVKTKDQNQIIEILKDSTNEWYKKTKYYKVFIRNK